MKSKKRSGTPSEESGGSWKWEAAAAAIVLPFLFSNDSEAASIRGSLGRIAKGDIRGSLGRVSKGSISGSLGQLSRGSLGQLSKGSIRGSIGGGGIRGTKSSYYPEGYLPFIFIVGGNGYRGSSPDGCDYPGSLPVEPSDSGKGNVMLYNSWPRASRPDWRKDFDKQKSVDQERKTRYKAAIAARWKRIGEVRKAEGLDEPDLVHYYLENLGESVDIVPMSMRSRTAAFYVTFEDHPNLIVTWEDKEWMAEMSKTTLGRIHQKNYAEMLTGISDGKMVYEMPGKKLEEILPELDGLAIRLGKKPLTKAQISDMPEYIMKYE